MPARYQEALPKAAVEEAFHSFDENRSGALDEGELRLALTKLGLDASRDETAALMHKYDGDGNRRLGLPEFTRLVSELRAFYARQPTSPRGDVSPRGSVSQPPRKSVLGGRPPSASSQRRPSASSVGSSASSARRSVSRRDSRYGD